MLTIYDYFTPYTIKYHVEVLKQDVKTFPGLNYIIDTRDNVLYNVTKYQVSTKNGNQENCDKLLCYFESQLVGFEIVDNLLLFNDVWVNIIVIPKFNGWAFVNMSNSWESMLHIADHCDVEPELMVLILRFLFVGAES